MRGSRGVRVQLRRLWGVAVVMIAAGCARDETPSRADTLRTADGRPDTTTRCAPDNGGLTLPAGFCATVFADTIGHARHIAIAPNGDVYINTWSGRYYGSAPPPRGAFVVALRDTTHDGVADVIARFGETIRSGGIGGTGIALHRGDLYVEANDRIVRYAMGGDALVPSGAPAVVVRNLPMSGDHPAHPFVIDSAGTMYVNSGSASNACGVRDRQPESPGHDPCTELETRAGIWRYAANAPSQSFSPRERYATGNRNATGLALGPGGSLYATQHGRDQLAEGWPKLYSAEQGQNLPAEELHRVTEGADFGWPYCYYDDTKQRRVLAPEYGGNGDDVGRCADKAAPVAAFPAHWAPNAIVFYTGEQFPAKYHNGVFIAFHGSWNRAPGPQGGYNVVFQPFANSKPSGPYEVFADGFAGGEKSPTGAAHRPSGLGVGPDGALYVTDDKAGRVWRIVYRGQ